MREMPLTEVEMYARMRATEELYQNEVRRLTEELEILRRDNDRLRDALASIAGTATSAAQMDTE